MLRQLFAFGFALIAWNATAEIGPTEEPLEEILALEIERLELEIDLFGDAYHCDEIVSIESIELYEPEEELELGFDTSLYLPADFNARAGMDDIDWSAIELFEIEEEDDFDPKDHLPEGFNPYEGLPCDTTIMLSSRL